ncbi:MAG: DUF86 domain-containing protein [Pyrinomonadaceae bacterium]|nr:DUF86 domain-containing protein [Pyrinomonadaceae bacterium]
MRPEEFFLRDIVIACRMAREFSDEVDRNGFEHSPLHQAAIQYVLLVIGEAVGHVSRGLKSRHPQVDWQSMKEFRNVLAHDYFALDLDVIWDAATRNTLNISTRVKEVLALEFPDFPVPENARLWK